MKAPEKKPPYWLLGSFIWAGAIGAVLFTIARLPFDEESPLARANLALIAILCGGLIGGALSAVSIARRETQRFFAIGWSVLNIGAAILAPITLHVLSGFSPSS